MSSRHQELIFRLAGQSLFYDAPEGRPTGSPTATVFLSTNTDDGPAEVALNGAPTVDAVNTTLGVAGVQGTSSLTVASSASVARNRRYLITDLTDGHQEWIDVQAVSAAGVITTRQPLINNYVINSTFVGTRITVSVLDSWLADLSKLTDVLWTTWRTDREPISEWPAGSVGYRARWSYTVTSATIGISFFDVVRYSSKNLVTPVEVDNRFPGWIDRLPPDYRADQGVTLLREALFTVKLDALGDAQQIRRIRETEVLRELTMMKANVLSLEAQVYAGSISNRAAVDLAAERYQQRYDQLIREPKVMVDQTASGASSQAKRLPITRR